MCDVNRLIKLVMIKYLIGYWFIKLLLGIKKINKFMSLSDEMKSD